MDITVSQDCRKVKSGCTLSSDYMYLPVTCKLQCLLTLRQFSLNSAAARSTNSIYTPCSDAINKTVRLLVIERSRFTGVLVCIDATGVDPLRFPESGPS